MSNVAMKNERIDKGIAWDSFAAVCWDMDHTLVRYNVGPLFALMHECTIRYLTQVVRFPSVHLSLDPSDFDPRYSSRGLIVDRHRGNFYEIDAEKRFVRVFHGEEEVVNFADVPTIVEAQRQFQSYHGALSFSEPFAALITYFEAGLGPIFARLVTLHDSQAHLSFCVSYSELFNAMVGSFRWNFTNYNKADSWFFSALRTDIQKYIRPQPLHFVHWIRSMKESGIRTVLITNSLPEYTKLLMDFAFGTDWISAFSTVVTSARKPVFFTSSLQAFVELDSWVTPSENDVINNACRDVDFHRSAVYCGGNARDFEISLEKAIGSDDLKLVYVGDHIQSDVFVPKQTCGWTAVAVIEELENSMEIERIERLVGHSVQYADAPTVHDEAPVPRHDNLYFLTTSHGKASYWLDILRHPEKGADAVVPSVEYCMMYHHHHLRQRSDMETFSSKDTIESAVLSLE
eukprot:ANDGO_01417.mRNA.1 Cytosolic purine 5'-nucleotidase